jgi:hypothetical protein
MEEVESVIADGRVGDSAVAAQAEGPDVGWGGFPGRRDGPGREIVSMGAGTRIAAHA